MYEDALVGIVYSKHKMTYIFAKWLILADHQLDWEKFPDLWQRDFEHRVKMLFRDDAERDLIQSALLAEGIKFDRAVNVSLTADQKELVTNARVHHHEDIEAVLKSAERIDAARTLDELKVELKRRLYIR